MERNWIKKCFTFVVLVVVGMGMFAGSAEAQEVSSISVEEQMIVDELAKQVAQLAEQVNELSLMVSKYVLEQQALVLVEQLEGMTGDSIAIVDVQAMVEEEPAPFAMIEESAKEVMEDSKTEEVVVEEIPTFVEEISTEDVFANIEIDEALVLGNTESKESGERQQRGFLAALSSFRDGLGRPELATIAILAFFAGLIVLRRLRNRRSKTSEPSQSQPQVITSLPSSGKIDDMNQELKERVSWQ